MMNIYCVKGRVSGSHFNEIVLASSEHEAIEISEGGNSWFGEVIIESARFLRHACSTVVVASTNWNIVGDIAYF